MTTKCRLCSNNSKCIFTTKVLKKYDVKYYFCSKCQFIQTEEPYWLEEAYSSVICAADTGSVARNLDLAKRVPILLYYFFNYNAQFVDYAGGYGIFTRMMRDIGFDFYWLDKYADNLLTNGFEYNKKIHKKIEAITSFESFEHFVNPIQEIENILSISQNVLFTTELLPTNIPQLNEWWYYAPTSGQHIAFYSKSTLEFLAKKYNLFFYSTGFLHLFTQHKLKRCQPLPFKYNLLSNNKNLFNYISKLYKKRFFKKILKKKFTPKTIQDHNLICGHKNLKHLK